MMDADEVQPVFIFHLGRNDGSAVFLHPFANGRDFVDIMESGRVEGRYGSEPRTEPFTIFRDVLYGKIDIAVRRWVSASHFASRLLAAAGIWAIGLLVLPDLSDRSLSLLAQFGIGAGLAVLGYIMLLRMELTSGAATRKRNELRGMIDQIYFQSDPFVLSVEAELNRIDTEDPEPECRTAEWSSASVPGSADASELGQLVEYLRRRFRLMDGRRREPLPSVSASSMRFLASRLKVFRKRTYRSKLDRSLIALYNRICENADS